MSNKSGRSEPNLFGGYTNYDSNGKKIGTSEPNLFGGYTNYDNKGHKIGTSEPGFFGGYTHYDTHGHKTGHSDPGILGGYSHYDSRGKKIGTTDPTLSGSYNHYSNSGSGGSSSGGCYVATCIYGSYDCPQVWTLRRYRDETLTSTWYGRAFIRCYYATSPTLVKWFGRTRWFNRAWKGPLDRMVHTLQERGFSSEPYEDRR